MNDSNNLFGRVVSPPSNPGTWIGKKWRGFISAALTCLLNPRIIVPVVDANGITSPQDAVITMGPNGWTAVLPAISGSSTASPLTTKGDIYGRSTVDSRIPVGADSFVLTADSTQALGLKWVAPGGGGSTIGCVWG